jgi:hypothetical protein
MKKIKKFLKNLSKTLLPGYDLGFAGKNLSSGKQVSFNENKVFGVGSVGKIPIALTLYHLYEQKKIDIEKPIYLDNFFTFDNKNRDAGILKFFPKNQPITLKLATLLMLSISDNFATNVVLETISSDVVNNFMTQLGLKNTKVLVKKIDYELFFNADHDFSQSSPKEMLTLIEMLIKGKILKKESADEILSFMSMEGAPYRLARDLPVPKNVFDEKLEIETLYSKGGTFPRIGTCSDVVVLKTKKEDWIVMVGFTSRFVKKHKEFHRHTAVDHISSKTLAKVGRLMYNYLK